MERTMAHAYLQKAPKKATNLSIDSNLLKKARELNINLSATLEQTLIKTIKVAQQKKWKKLNKSAVNTYNKHVEQHGVFSKNLRDF